jgi:ribosomal subunit interface protein
MRIQTKATNTTLTPSIENYIAKKVEGLERLIRQSDSSASLSVEVARTTEHHKKGDIFRAEFNLHTKEGDFHAVSERKDIYTALDEVKDELLDAFKTKKGKKMRLIRKGQLKVKEVVRQFYQ